MHMNILREMAMTFDAYPALNTLLGALNNSLL